MTGETMTLPPRRCWRCGRVTPMVWEAGPNRTACPHCYHTQPPRNKPNTVRQMYAWAKLSNDYGRKEGVELAQQRGKRGGKDG